MYKLGFILCLSLLCTKINILRDRRPWPAMERSVSWRVGRGDRIARNLVRSQDTRTVGRRCACDRVESTHPIERTSTRSLATDTHTASRLSHINIHLYNKLHFIKRYSYNIIQKHFPYAPCNMNEDQSPGKEKPNFLKPISTALTRTTYVTDNQMPMRMYTAHKCDKQTVICCRD